MIVWSGNDDGDKEVEGYDDGAAYNPSTGTWRKVPPGPLSGRWPYTTIWTGKEVLVWGGIVWESFASDGAAYDPSSNVWRRIATMPGRGRHIPATAWADDRLILWGGTVNAEGGTNEALSDGVVYEPQSDSWGVIPDAPLEPRVLARAVWTGRELLVWGGLGKDHRYFNDGAAFNFESGHWRRISASPLVPRLADVAIWTGREMIVWGGASDEYSRRAGPDNVRTHVDGAAYDPASDSWHGIDDFPLMPRRQTEAVWTGAELLIWGGIGGNGVDSAYFADGAAYSPDSGAWRVLPRSPLTSRWKHSLVWTGREAIIWGGWGPDDKGDGATYRPEDSA